MAEHLWNLGRTLSEIGIRVNRLGGQWEENSEKKAVSIVNKSAPLQSYRKDLHITPTRKESRIWKNRTTDLREDIRLLKEQVRRCLSEKKALNLELSLAKHEVGQLRAALGIQQHALKESAADIRSIEAQVRSRDVAIGDYVKAGKEIQEQIRFLKPQVLDFIQYKANTQSDFEKRSGQQEASNEWKDLKDSLEEVLGSRKDENNQTGEEALSISAECFQSASCGKIFEGPTPEHFLLQSNISNYISFLEAYDMGSCIGRGSHGQVFAATRNADNLPVAVKFIKMNRVNGNTQHPDDHESIPMEVATLRAVCAPPACPWIIQLLDWYCGPSEMLLIMEHPKQCMSLSEYAKGKRWSLPERQASQIFQKIVKAMQHCHARGVSHNDLKLDNILIELPTEQIKVIDFGYALFLEPEEGTHSTDFYAPAGCFLQDRSRTIPLTVKLLGHVLYKMLCGPLSFGRELEIMYNIFTCSRKLSMECQELIHWCLKPCPSDRPTLEEILKHPFIPFNQP